MPGTSDIGANIRELEQHGSRPRSHKQIIAIAISQARKAGSNIPKPKKSFDNPKHVSDNPARSFDGPTINWR